MHLMYWTPWLSLASLKCAQNAHIRLQSDKTIYCRACFTIDVLTISCIHDLERCTKGERQTCLVQDACKGIRCGSSRGVADRKGSSPPPIQYPEKVYVMTWFLLCYDSSSSCVRRLGFKLFWTVSSSSRWSHSGRSQPPDQLFWEVWCRTRRALEVKWRALLYALVCQRESQEGVTYRDRTAGV